MKRFQNRNNPGQKYRNRCFFSFGVMRFRTFVRLIHVMTDPKLTRQLVDLRDPMFRFARTLLQRTEEAEDAVADVVERLLASPQRLAGCRDLRSFAMTAVRNRCYDLLRQRQAGERRNERIVRQSEPAADAEAARWEVRELVRRALAELPQRQREVVHLKEIEGFTTRELAAMFATDEAQIRVWLSRGRCRMRAAIEKWMNDEPR